MSNLKLILPVGIAALIGLFAAALVYSGGTAVLADDDDDDDDDGSEECEGLPSHSDLTDALDSVVSVGDQSVNAGLANDMWGTIVNRDGTVCVVTFSGDDFGEQWLASRAISAQKANTANSLSLPAGAGGIIPGLALSTANLYSAVQPGGSLFGLQESNPVDTEVAYDGKAKKFGKENDPMVDERVGGINVFGGGLGLYDEDGNLLGGVGVSGDTSCTDHIIAWKVRDALGLDFVPGGVAAGAPDGTDNIIFDTTVDADTGHTVSASGFGHPACGFGDEVDIAEDLPTTHPIGD